MQLESYGVWPVRVALLLSNTHVRVSHGSHGFIVYIYILHITSHITYYIIYIYIFLALTMFHRLDGPQFIYLSPTEDRLGHFQLRGIMNKAAVCPRTSSCTEMNFHSFR